MPVAVPNLGTPSLDTKSVAQWVPPTTPARVRLRIPCVLMRGGTSRGPFFRAEDLPSDPVVRDRRLLAVIGAPQFRRVDGIGGMDPVTSKLAIVSRSKRPDADVDYLFGQADLKKSEIDYSPNCGNLLSAVAPFAIEEGMVSASHPETLVRVFNLNTKTLIDVVVQTPNGVVEYEGDFHIDGVPGTGSPIAMNFLDAVGSKTGKLFPTGQRRDVLDGVEVTCLDVGVPVVMVDARSLGKNGDEAPPALNEDAALLRRLEEIRQLASPRMGLGDCRGRVIPKICLVSPPGGKGDVRARYFTPDRCHPTMAVTGALCIAVASALEGTVTQALSKVPSGLREGTVTIEHPAGVLSVGLTLVGEGLETRVPRAAFLRTANRVYEGHAFVSEQVMP